MAHALEQATAYGIPHGEAVALGLVAECALAEALGVAPAGLGGRVAALLGRLGLPVRLGRALDAERRDAGDGDATRRTGRRGALCAAERAGRDGSEARGGPGAPAAAIREALGAIG